MALRFCSKPPAPCPRLRQAFEVVRRGGTIVQIGVFSAPEIPLPVNQLLVRELQFVGSFRYGNVWDEAIRLVASGRVNLQPLISRVFPLREANAGAGAGLRQDRCGQSANRI